MAKIAKSYRTLFVEGAVLQASDVRRAFDDAYDLVNGGLELDNFENISINQSNVSVNSSVWTSTALLGAIGEVIQPGYHSVHVYSIAPSSINIFPARIMINGRMSYINTRIVISASDHVLGGGSFSASDIFAMLIGNGSSNMITNSDIFFTMLTNISASLAWNSSKQGYYPSIASGTKRAVSVHFANLTASRIHDICFIDPPWNNQSYQLTNTEISQMGFCSNITSTWRFYDAQNANYYFNLRGRFTSASNTMFNEAGAAQNYWRVSNLNVVDEVRNNTLSVVNSTRDSQGNTLVSLNYNANGSAKYINVNIETCGAYYNVMMEPNSTFTGNIYFKYGRRG